MVTKEKYIEAVGRRKRAVARVRLTPASKTSYTINGKELTTYFPTDEMRQIATDVFKTVEPKEKFAVTVHISGGGIHAQAEAMRHGIARSLSKFDTEARKPLKTQGFLTRDAREKERRKFGLKKARKSPQWSKR